MNQELRRTLVFNAMEIYESLNSAVNSAGGVGFTAEQLKEMTAFDLLEILCTNHIRFVCTLKKEQLCA